MLCELTSEGSQLRQGRSTVQHQVLYFQQSFQIYLIKSRKHKRCLYPSVTNRAEQIHSWPKPYTNALVQLKTNASALNQVQMLSSYSGHAQAAAQEGSLVLLCKQHSLHPHQRGAQSGHLQAESARNEGRTAKAADEGWAMAMAKAADVCCLKSVCRNQCQAFHLDCRERVCFAQDNIA